MLFFDLDRTLLDHDGAQRTAASVFWRQHRAQDEPDLSRFLIDWDRRAEHHMQRYLLGEISFADQRRFRLREVLRNPELSDDEADVLFAAHLEHYEGAWSLFDDVLPCLAHPASQRIGLITNGDGPQQLRKLAGLGLSGRFAVVVISGDLGVAKPHANIFLEACRRADVAPDQAVYVGDRLDHDARAAAAAGLRGVWLDRKNGVERPSDVRRITSLDELHPPA